MPDLPTASIDQPDDIARGVVAYHVDDTAEPGDVVGALARVLIDAWRKRQQAEHVDVEHVNPDSTEVLT